MLQAIVGAKPAQRFLVRSHAERSRLDVSAAAATRLSVPAELANDEQARAENNETVDRQAACLETILKEKGECGVGISCHISHTSATTS